MAEGGTGTTVTEMDGWSALDEETRGYAAARGLDKLSPLEALNKTIQAHRNAEAKIGAPSDEMFRWKKDDPEALKTVYERLGVPKAPTDYNFGDTKVDEGMANFLRTTLHKLNVPANAATELAKELVGFQTKTAEEKASREKLTVAAAHDQLRANWGAEFDNNTFIANRALDLLGVPREVLNKIAEQSSFPTVMEGLLKIGRSMGEQKLLGLGGTNGGGNRILSAEEAASKRAELMADRDFVARWGKGDQTALKELDELNRIIVAAHQRGYAAQVAR
jgi:hypothetical protein